MKRQEILFHQMNGVLWGHLFPSRKTIESDRAHFSSQFQTKTSVKERSLFKLLLRLLFVLLAVEERSTKKSPILSLRCIWQATGPVSCGTNLQVRGEETSEGAVELSCFNREMYHHAVECLGFQIQASSLLHDQSSVALRDEFSERDLSLFKYVHRSRECSIGETFRFTFKVKSFLKNWSISVMRCAHTW